jgi:N-acetylmuramoyl-L-alanine amidase
MSIKIGLDAGHGLKTPGKETPDGIKEWTLNDKVRDKVVKILADYDCEILHVDNNEGNTDESLASRLKKYRDAGVKVFVSIHHNALSGKWNSATGVEVFTDKNPTEKDKELAKCIYDRLVKYTGLKGRGIKEENWYVINQNTIPAVLVEGGFMDGKKDYEYIISDAGQTAYAKAVAEGLIEFLGLKKKKVEKVETEKKPVKKDNPILDWQKAAIADGYTQKKGYFKKYGADGEWGKESEYVAEKAICKKRLIYTNKNLTKIVQKTVGVKADGKFGKATKDAVIKWQKKNGLKADGVVGISTWKKILNV